MKTLHYQEKIQSKQGGPGWYRLDNAAKIYPILMHTRHGLAPESFESDTAAISPVYGPLEKRNILVLS